MRALTTKSLFRNLGRAANGKERSGEAMRGGRDDEELEEAGGHA